MSKQSADLVILIPVPREQYLVKNEGRIRDQALPLRNNGDPTIAKWLNGVLAAESLFDIHDLTARKYAETDRPARSEMHARFAHDANQLKLSCLDQLAHLVL